MGKNDRCRGRQPRRTDCRSLELGYYLIATDASETEVSYLYGFKDSLPAEVKDRLEIRVLSGVRVNQLVKRVLEHGSYDPQIRKNWIIFDKDQVGHFNSIIEKAKQSGVNVGWSNICIEVWLMCYFENMRYFHNSTSCCQYFGDLFYRRTGIEYRKNDPCIYHHLARYGDENMAIERAGGRYKQHLRDSENPDDANCMNPCSTVFKLIKEIRQACRPI